MNIRYASIGLALMVVISFVFIYSNAFEVIHNFTHANEDFHLGEVILIGIASLFGGLVFLLLTVKDALRERRQAEENLRQSHDELEVCVARRTNELRESEERLNAILNNTTAVVFLKDVEGRYIFINRRFETLFHITNDDIQGKTDHDIFSKEAADAFRNNDLKVLKENVPIEMEEAVPHDDGTHTYISVKFPLHDLNGQPYAVCGISTDITGRKHFETKLRESEIRYRIFAADIAHELRTPLSVIKLHLDDLEDSDAVQILRQDVNSMSRLVEQLLTLARLEDLVISKDDKVDLHALCVTVAAKFAPLTIKENRSIEVTGKDSPVIIRGKLDHLDQALSNLVENAIKYSARGTTVTINLEDDAKISVIDHGQGVPLDMRKEIFNRFLRSDRRSGGAGLGLSIVRRIIDSHDGSIEVGDTPGGGATFLISFTHAFQ